MDIQLELKKRVMDIEEIIKQYLPAEEGFQKTVLEAMNYSILAGGKRLRPMLMQETYRLFGGKEKVIEPFMAAIEMIHTYSLVHDDLPAMDNDEYRRGKKTTHAVYGEAMGILAGDALLNYAYETAAKAFSMEPGKEAVGQAFLILAEKAGIYGMVSGKVGGQVVDVESEGSSISKEKLDFIYRLKTGALIESAMLIGAVLAGASKEEQKTVEEIAGEVGKPVGSDKKNRKATYVAWEGIDRAREEVKRLSADAVEKLHSFSGDYLFLDELLRYLIHREK